jgi:hypothetical protein
MKLDGNSKLASKRVENSQQKRQGRDELEKERNW